MMNTAEFLVIVKEECEGKRCRDCVFRNACIYTLRTVDYKKVVNDAIKIAEKLNYKKTFADDFFEKFPDATKNEDGKPRACRKALYPNYTESCCGFSCNDCWNEIMIEEEILHKEKK